MRRYGVDEGVIMQIGGWKTRSVLQRYNIVSEADITEASREIEGRTKTECNQAYKTKVPPQVLPYQNHVNLL